MAIRKLYIKSTYSFCSDRMEKIAACDVVTLSCIIYFVFSAEVGNVFPLVYF